jgi:hypothetical protein
MVLFDDIVHVVDLPNGNRGAILITVTPEGRGIGLAPTNRHPLRHPMAANGLGEEMSGRALVPMPGERGIDHLPHLIDRTIEEVSAVIAYYPMTRLVADAHAFTARFRVPTLVFAG